MQLDYSLPNLLILLGALQSLIFAFVLLARKKHKSHLFLSIFMLSLSYNAFETFTAVSGLGSKIVFFDLFSFTTVFLLGPSFYLYIKSVLSPELSISKKSLRLHYAPTLFQLGVNLFLFSTYLFSSTQIIQFRWDFGQLYNVFDFYSEPLSIVVFSGYIIMAIKLYWQAKGDQKGLVYPSTLKRSVLKLTKVLLITMSVFSVLWLSVYVLPFLVKSSLPFGYYPIEIALIFFIYWISFGAHYKMQLIHEHLLKSKQSIISQAEASLLMAQLQELMEETKLYLNPKITREQLAKEANLNIKTLSSILNQHHGQSFNDFINSYRIEEVKIQLHSQKLLKQTITGIAFGAGFNSQATFQRVFKNTVGMSPKVYLSLSEKEVIK